MCKWHVTFICYTNLHIHTFTLYLIDKYYKNVLMCDLEHQGYAHLHISQL